MRKKPYKRLSNLLDNYKSKIGMEKRITGNVLSDGLCVGYIVKWTVNSAPLDYKKAQITEESRQRLLNEEAECDRFREVKNAVAAKLTSLLSCAENSTVAAGDAERAEIIRSYITILNDPELENDVVQRIREQKVFLPEALTLTAQEYSDDMSALEDEYLKQRAQDFEQLFAMLLSYASGNAQRKVCIENPCILAAKALSPIDLSEIKICCSVLSAKRGAKPLIPLLSHAPTPYR